MDRMSSFRPKISWITITPGWRSCGARWGGSARAPRISRLPPIGNLTSVLRGIGAARSTAAASERELGERPERVHVSGAGEDGRDRALLPRGEAIADALLRADERDLVGEAVGHGGGGLVALSGEEELLDAIRLLLVAHAAHEVRVEVVRLRPHAADVEGQHVLDGKQRLLEVVVDVHRDRAADLEAGLPGRD